MTKPTASAATTAPSAPQKARRAARANGRFKGNKCERCAKAAPMDYFSDPRCAAHGWGVVLCERCAKTLALLSDEEFAAEAHG